MKSSHFIRRSMPAVFCAALVCASFTCAQAQFNNPLDPNVVHTPAPPDNGPPPAPGTAATPTPAAHVAPKPAATAATPTPAMPGFVPMSDTGNTVVNANQRVQPTKRGVCENQLSAEDMRVLSKGVSWYYNWSANDSSGGGGTMKFIPMAWGRPGQTAPGGGRAVLAINEPNLKGQAFLTPEETAKMYKEIKASAGTTPVIGPNMALGSGADASITAVDPFTKKKMTYTSMEDFLKAFYFYAGKGNTGSLGMHSYGGMGDLKFGVSKGKELSGKPVWVTEFALYKAGSDQEELAYMKEAVEYLENSPDVGAYAWFKEREPKNPRISLLKGDGKLTPLGEEYVKLPSHSVHVFYRIPGLLEAGKYVKKDDNIKLDDTTDAEGDFDMVSTGGSWVEYNLQVDVPGTYTLKFRVSGAPGKINVVENGQFLGSAEATQVQWHTVETTVQLMAGAQTLRICCDGQRIHSIEFVIKDSVAMK